MQRGPSGSPSRGHKQDTKKPSSHLNDAWHERAPPDTLTRATTTPSNLPAHDGQLRHLLLPHRQLRPPPQRLPDLLHALDIPRPVPMMAEREQHRILGARDPLVAARGAPARDDVDVLADVLAEGVERQAVDIAAERALGLAADERDAQDDVGGEQRARDRHPPERLVQPERQQQGVRPG